MLRHRSPLASESVSQHIRGGWDLQGRGGVSVCVCVCVSNVCVCVCVCV